MNAGELNRNILWIAAATLAVLAIGTVVRLVSLRGATREVAIARLGSLATWWIVAVVVTAAALLGRGVTAALFALVSVIAFREYALLSPERRTDRHVQWAAYALIPLNYLWLALGWAHVYVVFLPLAALLVLSLMWVIKGHTVGFVDNVPRLYFGLLVTTYCLGFTVLLFELLPSRDPVGGGAGWFLFAVLLTEGNDICQALVGRKLGRHHLTPRISPHKTWEGFAGGLAITMGVSLVLGRWLTPLRPTEAVFAGLIIAMAGFVGDVNISAVKRDCGAKDSSHLLPGQGGMLDRIDSLTFSAPAFYYFVLLYDSLPIEG